MLNKSKELLCIYVLFQESRGLIREEPETNKWHAFYHIGEDFQAV